MPCITEGPAYTTANMGGATTSRESRRAGGVDVEVEGLVSPTAAAYSRTFSRPTA